MPSSITACSRLPAAALAVAVACTLVAAFAAVPARAARAAAHCVPVGEWRVPSPAGPRASETAEIVGRSVAARSVLLGESHDSAEHHRWQLQVLAAVHARQPGLVIALEMFPRSAQPALDRWVAGELDEARFLRESRWAEVWGFDPALYLPILHFARMNRVPLVGINVSREFTREVAEQGLEAVPAARREGVGTPAAALPGYEDLLFGSWRDHLPPGESHGSADRDAPAFRRFVESQQVWDRAMAEGMAGAAARHPGAVVVALVGSGHVVHGYGVAHQLQALGQPAPLLLLPFERDGDCAALDRGLADAVFGLATPPPVPAAARPRLGVTLEPVADGVRIAEVAAGSIAERAGLRTGDLLLEVAGTRPERAADVAAAVQRQAPGTWLPIRVRRDGRDTDVVARFPPAPER